MTRHLHREGSEHHVRNSVAALSNIDAQAGFLAGLSRRLEVVWPDLARTVIATVVAEVPRVASARGKKAGAVVEVPLAEIAQTSEYAGPGGDAVRGETPDEG